MAKKNEAPAAPVTLASLGLENYEVIEVHRSELKNAPYNPRVLSDEGKRKLRTILKKHGMVSPPTWNRRTGNICGGHQRLQGLDILAKSPNYTLKVAVIDVDEKKEREINIALNNDEAQGVWDLGKLGEILKDTETDIEGTGFDPADVMRIFGDTMVAKADDTRFDELALQLDTMRETFKRIDNRAEESEFYCVVVFRSGEHRDQFLRENNLPLDRYQSGAKIQELVKFGREPSAPHQQEASKDAVVPDTAPAQ